MSHQECPRCHRSIHVFEKTQAFASHVSSPKKHCPMSGEAPPTLISEGTIRRYLDTQFERASKPGNKQRRCGACGRKSTTKVVHVPGEGWRCKEQSACNQRAKAKSPPKSDKLCIQCRETKPLTEFNQSTISKDGRRSKCRECQSDPNRIPQRKKRAAKIVSSPDTDRTMSILSESISRIPGICSTCATATATRTPIVHTLARVIFCGDVDKPIIDLIDVIDGAYEVVNCSEKTIFYDELCTVNGLTLNELLSWWDQRCESNGDGSKSLYRHFQLCMEGEASQYERRLLEFYYREFAQEYRLLDQTLHPRFPALLPQAYTRIFHDRSPRKIPGAVQRVDFLMILPGNKRYIIEIDGRHHYTNDHGQVSPERYGDMCYDRRNLPDSYELHSFGGQEFDRPNINGELRKVFTKIFEENGIKLDQSDLRHCG